VCCRSILARWEVSRRSGSEGDMGGVRCVLPLLLHVSRLGPGQGRQGIDKGESRALWDGLEHARGAVMHCTNSEFDLVGFLPGRCLTKCPQEVKI
jgi:hypothetical protein